MSHNDIKPENILLERQQHTNLVKLINFKTNLGFKYYHADENGKGNAYYQAPETS